MKYPNERQIEYWTSRAVEEYFDNEGYTTIVLPNSQHAEKHLPYDHLFAGEGIKIFGFQYKRLYPGNQEDYWKIDINQYNQIQKYSWIYYALSEVNSIARRRNALHLLVIMSSIQMHGIVNSTSASQQFNLNRSRIGVSKGVPYYRWGGFVQGLLSCKIGWKPSTEEELQVVFENARDIKDTLVDLYLVAPSLNTAIRMTPFIRDIEDTRDPFDFGINK
ncbi:hypothetical protein [Oceanithermus sp.]|uniref:hypothetical protein n=1 Tax=Oceanithermus sp. TaxID=2268145 RepID=UPI00257E7345|nr:hypothetical protein [Oceanithermus sp.]